MASEITTVGDDHNEDEVHVLTAREAQAELEIYAKTMGVLRPLIESARALAILRGALAAGIVQSAREPCTPNDLAAALHLDQHRFQAVCAALEAHGIFVQENTTYHLADVWSALASPAALPWVRTGAVGAYRSAVQRRCRMQSSLPALFPCTSGKRASAISPRSARCRESKSCSMPDRLIPHPQGQTLGSRRREHPRRPGAGLSRRQGLPRRPPLRAQPASRPSRMSGGA